MAITYDQLRQSSGLTDKTIYRSPTTLAAYTGGKLRRLGDYDLLRDPNAKSAFESQTAALKNLGYNIQDVGQDYLGDVASRLNADNLTHMGGYQSASSGIFGDPIGMGELLRAQPVQAPTGAFTPAPVIPSTAETNPQIPAMQAEMRRSPGITPEAAAGNIAGNFTGGISPETLRALTAPRQPATTQFVQPASQQQQAPMPGERVPAQIVDGRVVMPENRNDAVPQPPLPTPSTNLQNAPTTPSASSQAAGTQSDGISAMSSQIKALQDMLATIQSTTFDTAPTDLEKQIQTSINALVAKQAAEQAKIENEQASLRLGQADVYGQPIAMKFIQGQGAELERKALARIGGIESGIQGLGAQQVPLEQQLIQLQKERTQKIETQKAKQAAAIDVAKTGVSTAEGTYNRLIKEKELELNQQKAQQEEAYRTATLNKPETVSPGQTVIDPKTGKVIYQAAPDSSKQNEQLRDNTRAQVSQAISTGAIANYNDDILARLANDGAYSFSSLKTMRDSVKTGQAEKARQEQQKEDIANRRLELAEESAARVGANVNKIGTDLSNQLKALQIQQAEKELREGKPATEAEKRAFNFYGRAQDADQNLKIVEDQIKNLGPAGQARLRYAPNILQDQVGQLQKQSEDQFIEAYLRKDSGAVIPPSEYAAAKSTYFPQVGDTQKTLDQKRASREKILNGLKQEAGKAYTQSYGTPSSGASQPSSRPSIDSFIR